MNRFSFRPRRSPRVSRAAEGRNTWSHRTPPSGGPGQEPSGADGLSGCLSVAGSISQVGRGRNPRGALRLSGYAFGVASISSVRECGETPDNHFELGIFDLCMLQRRTTFAILPNDGPDQVLIGRDRILRREGSYPGTQRLTVHRPVEGGNHGFRQPYGVSNGHERSEPPTLKHFRGTGGTVGADARAAARERLDQHSGETLESRGQHEKGCARHESERILRPTRQGHALGQAKARDQAFERPSPSSFAEDDEAARPRLGNTGEGLDEGGIVLLSREPAGRKDDRHLAVVHPRVVGRLRHLSVEVRRNDRVVYDGDLRGGNAHLFDEAVGDAL